MSALNGALQVSVAPAPSGTVEAFHYECSSDGGTTWSTVVDAEPDTPAATIPNLKNGTDYVCRAFARNTTGVSDASAISDSVRPCNGLLECNGLVLPIVGGLGALLAAGILLALIALYRGRTTGYVLAVVDIVHSANIGHGSTLGIAFDRDPTSRAVTGDRLRPRRDRRRPDPPAPGRAVRRPGPVRPARGRGRRPGRDHGRLRRPALARPPGVRHERGLAGRDAPLSAGGAAGAGPGSECGSGPTFG